MLSKSNSAPKKEYKIYTLMEFITMAEEERNHFMYRETFIQDFQLTIKLGGIKFSLIFTFLLFFFEFLFIYFFFFVMPREPPECFILQEGFQSWASTFHFHQHSCLIDLSLIPEVCQWWICCGTK